MRWNPNNYKKPFIDLLSLLLYFKNIQNLYRVNLFVYYFIISIPIIIIVIIILVRNTI